MKWFLLIPFILCVICIIFLCFSILKEVVKNLKADGLIEEKIDKNEYV